MGCQCIMQNNYNSDGNSSLQWVTAGFVVRLVAYTLDVLIVGVGVTVVKAPFWIGSLILQSPFWSRDILFQYSLVDIIGYLCGVIYFILMTYYSGNTLGKRVMNLRVVSRNSNQMTWLQVIYRETIGRFLSGVIYGIGYLMILGDQDKRALHDMLAETKVIYAKKMTVDVRRSNVRNISQPIVNTEVANTVVNQEVVNKEVINREIINKEDNNFENRGF